MPKVHPKATVAAAKRAAAPAPEPEPCQRTLEEPPEQLTVWAKSLLLNGSGFTVYDSNGNLVFRVDNYAAAAGHKAEILLMDASGKPLLTIRRKMLSLGEQWLIYKGEETGEPWISMRKHYYVSLLHPRSSTQLARLLPCTSGGGGGVGYVVEGSYCNRSCAVYSEQRRVLAEIRRKEAAAAAPPGAGFGSDVFSLFVYPGFDAAVAMAVVVILEQMFGSRR